MFVVREFGGRKYLTMRKDVSVVESAPDIAIVADVSDEDKLDSDKTLQNAEIVAIPEFVHKKICHRCGSTVSPGVGDPPSYGTCLNCGMIQKYELCSTKFYARLMFTSDEESGMVLTASSDNLKKLVGVHDVTEIALISLPKLQKAFYTGSSVIPGIESDSRGGTKKLMKPPSIGSCESASQEDLFDALSGSDVHGLKESIV